MDRPGGGCWLDGDHTVVYSCWSDWDVPFLSADGGLERLARRRCGILAKCHAATPARLSSEPTHAVVASVGGPMGLSREHTHTHVPRAYTMYPRASRCLSDCRPINCRQFSVPRLRLDQRFTVRNYVWLIPAAYCSRRSLHHWTRYSL